MGKQLTKAKYSKDHILSYQVLDVEQILEALCAYGEPVISKSKYGWSCRIDMHVSAKGTSCEVKSEFGKETPIIAARECASRVIETVNYFKE